MADEDKKEKAPAAPGESSSAQTVISAAPSSGLTSQKLRKCGNSSGLPTAVSMARPRADAPYICPRPIGRK